MTYGIQSLYLFPTRSRAQMPGYREPFDPSRRVKAWIDPAADPNSTATITYRVFNPQATKAEDVFVDLVLTQKEAATYNLTGKVDYPPYVVAPTKATRRGDLVIAINPIYLSTAKQAEEMMSLLGGHALGDEANLSAFVTEYPADEQRRLWYFMWKGQEVNVGALLYNRHANGVGAPGKWDLNGVEPVWVPAPPAPTGENSNLGTVPVPVRALEADEKVIRTMMDWAIQKGEDQPGVGGGITPEQFADLYQLARENNTLLKQLMKALRV